MLGDTTKISGAPQGNLEKVPRTLLERGSSSTRSQSRIPHPREAPRHAARTVPAPVHISPPSWPEPHEEPQIPQEARLFQAGR